MIGWAITENIEFSISCLSIQQKSFNSLLKMTRPVVAKQRNRRQINSFRRTHTSTSIDVIPSSTVRHFQNPKQERNKRGSTPKPRRIVQRLLSFPGLAFTLVFTDSRYYTAFVGPSVKKTILYVGCFRPGNWESIWQRENMLAEFLSKRHHVFYAWIVSVKEFLADLMCTVANERHVSPTAQGCQLARYITELGAWLPAEITVLAHQHMSHKKIQAKYLSRGHDLHFFDLPVARYSLTRTINSKVILFQIRKLMRRHRISCFDTVIISNPMFFAPYVLNH